MVKLHHCAVSSYDILKWIIFKGYTCIGAFKVKHLLSSALLFVKDVSSVPCLFVTNFSGILFLNIKWKLSVLFVLKTTENLPEPQTLLPSWVHDWTDLMAGWCSTWISAAAQVVTWFLSPIKAGTAGSEAVLGHLQPSASPSEITVVRAHLETCRDVCLFWWDNWP